MICSSHRPHYRGFSCVCSDCGQVLFDVRTGASLKALNDVDPIKLAAVVYRFSFDPELAQRLVDEDPREVVSTYKFADKFNDFLMNPKARPDLQKPEAQDFLNKLKNKYLNSKTDELMPWIMREWKKGRIRPGATGLEANLGPDYEYQNPDGSTGQWHHIGEAALDHWADWYQSDHPSRKGKDIMQMQAPDMHRTVNDWDTEMRQKARQDSEIRGDIVHQFPDGWNIQQLKTPEQLQDEGEAMGHCVGGYHHAVKNGQSLIYSLRDHNNEPHATWEIHPNYFETPHGRYDVQRGEYEGDPPGPGRPHADYAVPHQGTIVQVQGKGNREPIPEYKERIKDYFEKAMPNPEERPRLEDDEYGDLADLPYDYDPEDPKSSMDNWASEYGLPDQKITFDWPTFGDALLHEYHNGVNGRGQEYDARNLIDFAHAHGGLGELKSWYEKNHPAWQNEAADDWNKHREFYPEDYGFESEEVDPEEYETEAEYQKAQQEAEERNLKYQDEMEQDAWREYWGSTGSGQFVNEWEEALAHHELEQQRQQEAAEGKGGEVVGPNGITSRVSRKQGRVHANWSTGKPCNCTFTDHLDPQEFWKISTKLPVCEVCGDPLEHGKCKRCDWGDWSNAMGPGDQNPQDPTKELHPGIQARWRPE